MTYRIVAAALPLALILLTGCAKTKVTEVTPQNNEAIARPNRILVYDFVASISSIPPDSAINGQVGAPSTQPTSEEAAAAGQLGRLIADDLVAEIQAMGLSAARAAPGSSPQVGDGVIRGYLVSLESGNSVKRFVIGFGAGTSEMDTLVEGYVMTPRGLHKLGSGMLTSTGGKTPGTVLPAAVAIASGSPVGLIVVGGAKLYGEASGRNALEGRAKATADEIAEQLKVRFQDRGWI
jgi:hypothetical protein